jgi:drug/metabolite transporter superfamily protein YnfA
MKWKIIAIILFAQRASASGCYIDYASLQYLREQLRIISGPLGFLMVILLGIKWMVAEGPEERENARRGIIYVVIGMLLVRASWDLTIMLLC